MQRFLYRSSLLSTLICVVALSSYADMLWLKNGQVLTGQYEGGTDRVVRFRTDSGVREYALIVVLSVGISDSTAAKADRTTSSGSENVESFILAFDSRQERIIRVWFSDRANLRGLPPGLARRESLPPGLERQIRRNGVLPPGLQRRVHPLPIGLEVRLPELPDGWSRVVLSRNVLLIEVATGRVVDILHSVF